MIRAIIIDDEKHAIVTLEFLLQQIDNVEVITTIQDSTQAKEIIEKAITSYIRDFQMA